MNGMAVSGGAPVEANDSALHSTVGGERAVRLAVRNKWEVGGGWKGQWRRGWGKNRP